MADTSLSPRRLAYLAGVRRQKRRVRIWQLALLIGLFGFWELSCRTGLSDGFLVSCPSRMAATFWSLCRSGQLLHHIGVSCLETVLASLPAPCWARRQPSSCGGRTRRPASWTRIWWC